MSRLINVPPPGAADARPDGLDSYATVPLSLRVAQRENGTCVVSMQIGEVQADLRLDGPGRRHLASLLTDAPTGGAVQ